MHNSLPHDTAKREKQGVAHPPLGRRQRERERESRKGERLRGRDGESAQMRLPMVPHAPDSTSLPYQGLTEAEKVMCHIGLSVKKKKKKKRARDV